LKPERWGSLLVQEKYQEEKACDKRHPYRIIIIIIIIIIMHTDRCDNTCRQKCCANGSGKQVKEQEFMY
jgi:hypothetical protein